MKRRFPRIKIHIKTSALATIMAVCMLTQSAADVMSLFAQGTAKAPKRTEETAETVRVRNKEKLALVDNAGADTRTPLTILEIIPHDVCSIFPYLIEWGDKESYDANVPIGYNGVARMINKHNEIKASAGPDVAAGNSLFYTYTPRGMKQESLDDYAVRFATDENDQQGLWYRAYEPDKKHDRTENGYFLNVKPKTDIYGKNNKGLYHLSLEPDDIKTQVRTPGMGKGSYELQDFWYYMTEDEAGEIAKDFPKQLANGSWEHIGMTAKNYTLAFHRQGRDGTAAGDYQYIVKQAVPDKEGSYALDAEFVPDKKGAYAAASVAEATEGLYIRINDGSRNDSYQNTVLNLVPGYFRLYNEQTDTGRTRYDVSFEISTMGSYKEQFVYAGEKKGNFSVWFRPAETGRGMYAPEKLAVRSGRGDYVAVAKTIMHTGKPTIVLPEYTEAGKNKGDYNLVITSVVASAVGSDPSNQKDYDWIWVPVDDASEMEETLYGELNRQSGRDGTRVYLKNFTRQYAYYSMPGFVNNEWFKLRCLFTDETDAAEPYPYNAARTAIDNLTAASAKIRGFDAGNRIQIIRKRPQDVATADIDRADLIYFSNKEAIQGIRQNWHWLLTGENGNGGDINLSYGDISFAVAERIYNKCIVNEDAALMMDIELQCNVDSVTGNIKKLYYMIHGFEGGKRIFAQFLPSSGAYNDDYTMVTDSGAVEASYVVYDGIQRYNPTTLLDGSGYGRHADSQSTWEPKYFIVYNTKEVGGILYPDSINAAYKTNYNMQLYMTPSNTYLTFGDTTQTWFQKYDSMGKIWIILHNRNMPVTLEVTNAALTGGGELVIYADELDTEFPVEYVVTSNRGTTAQVTISFSDGIGEEQLYNASVPLNTKQRVNVRKGFTKPYGSSAENIPLDSAIRKRKVMLSAEGDNGSTVEATVWVIVRDMFTLN